MTSQPGYCPISHEVKATRNKKHFLSFSKDSQFPKIVSDPRVRL